MVPVVIASAADREPAGVAGFFPKPLDVRGLLKKVHETLVPQKMTAPDPARGEG